MKVLFKYLFNTLSIASTSGRIMPEALSFQTSLFSKNALDLVMRASYHGSPLLIRYQVRKGRLFLHSFRCNMLSNRSIMKRCIVMTGALQKACMQYRFADTDFILTLHDSFTHTAKLPSSAPIFSFAKNHHKEPNILLIPDFEILLGYKPLPTKIPPWDQKIPLATWRGATTGGIYTRQTLASLPRVRLISFSQKHPDYLDARFNTHCVTPDIEKELIAQGFMGNSLSIAEQLHYKYQILIDGNSCAYSRAYWQLASDTLMFKIDSDNIQWYYEALKPYEHYVPVKADLSNLAEQIEWARANDEEAKSIIKRANAFAKEHLTEQAVYSYLAALLTRYSQFLH